MDVAEAEALAARILAVIAAEDHLTWLDMLADYSREQVASDLAGLREHAEGVDADWRHQRPVWPCADADRYAASLRRTASLYGVAVPA